MAKRELIDWANRESVQSALDAAGSVRKLADACGIARSTAGDRIDKVGAVSPHSVSRAPERTIVKVIEREQDPAEVLELNRRVAAMQAQNQSLRDQMKVANVTRATLDLVRREILPVFEGISVRPVKAADPKREVDRNAVTLLAHWNDWHWGELVDPETVSMQNAYSPGIAATRVRRLVDVTAAWIRNYDELQGVAKLVITCNGDQFSGMHQIHPDSAEEYALIAKQAGDCALVTAQAVARLAPLVPEIEIHVPAGDNHTRSTRMPPTGTAALETSWSALYAELVAALLTTVENVSIKIHRSYKAHIRINDVTVAAAHGHGLKGGGGNLGIPAYALKRMHDATVTRSVTRARADALTGDILAGIVKHTRIGHFHTFAVWQMGEGTTGITPSIKGVDSFVIDRLERYSPAAALIEVFHPTYEIIGQHLVDVQSIQQEADHGFKWGILEGGDTAASIMRAWAEA